MQLSAQNAFQVIFPKYVQLLNDSPLHTDQDLQSFIRDELPQKIQLVRSIQPTFITFQTQFTNLILKRPKQQNLIQSLVVKASQKIDKYFYSLQMANDKQVNKNSLANQLSFMNLQQLRSQFRQKIKQLNSVLKEKYFDNYHIQRNVQEQIARRLYILNQIYYFMKNDLPSVATKFKLKQHQILAAINRNSKSSQDKIQLSQLIYLEDKFIQNIHQVVGKRCRPFMGKKDFFFNKLKQIQSQTQSKVPLNINMLVQSILGKQKYRITKQLTSNLSNQLKAIDQSDEQELQKDCKQIIGQVDSLKKQFNQLKNNAFYLDIIRGSFSQKYKMQLNKLQNIYYLSNIQKYLQDIQTFTQKLIRIQQKIIQNRKSFMKKLGQNIQEKIVGLITQYQVKVPNFTLKQVIDLEFKALQNSLYGILTQELPKKQSNFTNLDQNKRKRLQQAERRRKDLQYQKEQKQRIRRQQIEQKAQKQRLKRQQDRIKLQQKRRSQEQRMRKMKQQRQQKQRIRKIQQDQKQRIRKIQMQQKMRQKRINDQKDKERLKQQMKRKQQQKKIKESEQLKKRQKLKAQKEQEQKRKKQQLQQKRKQIDQQKQRKQQSQRMQVQKMKSQKQQRQRQQRQQRQRLQRQKKEQQQRQRRQRQSKQQQQRQQRQKIQREMKNQRQKEQRQRKQKLQKIQREKREEQQRLEKQKMSKLQRQKRQVEQKQKARQAQLDKQKRQKQQRQKNQKQQKQRKQRQEREKAQRQEKQRKQRIDRERRQRQQRQNKQKEQRQRRQNQLKLQRQKQLKQKKQKQQRQRRQRQEQQKKQKLIKQAKQRQERQRKQKQQKALKQKLEQQKKQNLQSQKREKQRLERQRKQKQQKQRKQLQLLMQEQQNAKKNKSKVSNDRNKKGGSGINYNDFDDIIDDDLDQIDQKQQQKQSKVTKNKTKNKAGNDQYDDYQDDFESPQKQGEQQDPSGMIEPKQLITAQTIKCLNDYMKGTSYSRKNKPNLQPFNHKDYYTYIFQQLIQSKKMCIFQPSVSSAVLDFSKQLLNQEADEQELKMSIETIKQFMLNEYQSKIREQQFNSQIVLVLPFSFQNQFDIKVIQFLPAIAWFRTVLGKELPEGQQVQSRFNTVIQALLHVFEIQDQPKIENYVLNNESSMVLSTFERQLPCLLTIFAMHYETQFKQSINITQYTVQRFFYTAQILKPFYESIEQNQQQLGKFYEKTMQKYQNNEEISLIPLIVQSSNPQYETQLFQHTVQLKQQFLANKKQKTQLVLYQILLESQPAEQQEQEQIVVQKITIYGCMERDASDKTSITYFIVTKDEQQKQNASTLFDIISEGDDGFEVNVFMDFTRHNGLTQYSDWTLPLWARTIQKRKLTPINAFRAITFAMSPYYIAFKEQD